MKIDLSQAIAKLNEGKLVAIPTETVYGVATKYTNEQGVKEIFTLKGRSFTNPMSILISDISQLNSIVESFPLHSVNLMNGLWPGPLTLVMPSKETILTSIRAGLPSIGVRMPSNEITLALIQKTGPLVCPSANISGRPSPTKLEHVEEDFGKEFPILGGEGCSEGIESTILDFQHDKWVILRSGVYRPSDFYPILGYLPEVLTEKRLSSTHYRPNAKIVLGLPPITEPNATIIGFNEGCYSNRANLYKLGSLKNLQKCQKNLYSILREVDSNKIQKAYIDTNFTHLGSGALLWERIKSLSN